MAVLNFKNAKIADKVSFSVQITLVVALVLLMAINTILLNQLKIKQTDTLRAGFTLVEEIQEGELWDEINSALNLAADGLSRSAVNALANNDLEMLRELAIKTASVSDLSTDKFAVTVKRQNQKIAFIKFLNPLGETIVIHRSDENVTTSGYEVVRPVIQGTTLLGFITIGANISTLEENVKKLFEISESIALEQAEIINSQQISVVSGIAISFILLAFFLFFILRRFIQYIVIKPINKIENAIDFMQKKGDFSTELDVESKDEIGQLTQKFNDAFAYLHDQNEKLNDAVISLLNYADKIANEHNLGVKIPVTEDVTGLVADAFNNLTKEFSGVIKQVQDTSTQVSNASDEVRNQNLQVVEASQKEQETLKLTTQSLTKAVDVMKQIANFSRASDQAAKEINTATDGALGSLTASIQGMNSIKDNIQETGKRIKRLGERSQEITVVVDIINNIAERTNVLALNAGIQAAAAGEAGKTFTVIAAEVQHLAENSRDATAQIAALVKNIQAETAETIAAMDKTTSEIISQSKLVETAGKTMENSRQAVHTSSKAVEHIVQSSMLQIKTSQSLLQELEKMRFSVEQTSQKLAAQETQISALVQSSETMLETVGIFKLSE